MGAIFLLTRMRHADQPCRVYAKPVDMPGVPHVGDLVALYLPWKAPQPVRSVRWDTHDDSALIEVPELELEHAEDVEEVERMLTLSGWIRQRVASQE